MEHLALAALTVGVALFLFARERSLRRTILDLQHRISAAEADSRATSELASVGELVSGLAHELRTPLQGVLGNTELMLAEQPRTEELRDIHDHATRAADIVRHLVAFSETKTLARRWQDLNELTARAIDAARQQIAAAGNSVQFAPADRLPVVYVDGRQLEKAIAVLLGHGGSVRRPDDRAVCVQVTTSLGAGEDRLVIDVEFQGITQDAVERALAGALTTCRHVVRAHGGRVTVDSRTDAAGVQVELPATIVELAERVQSPTTTQESSPSWKTPSTSSTSTVIGT